MEGQALTILHGQVGGIILGSVFFFIGLHVSINGGSGNTVDNVKVIAWLGNSDGIQASYGPQDAGSVIENSFVKNGDDSIKLTASNLLVCKCVVWEIEQCRRV